MGFKRIQTPYYKVMSAYAEGVDAALDGAPEHACPYSEIEIGLRCGWMGGYHDTWRGRDDRDNNSTGAEQLLLFPV